MYSYSYIYIHAQDGKFESGILLKLLQHGMKGQRLVFLRADNFQRLFNAVASASARDPSLDRAFLVIVECGLGLGVYECDGADVMAVM